VRSTLLDAARRTYLNLTRGTLKKTNDKELMQEVDVHLFGPAGKNDGKVKIERFQQYGFSAVPHKKKDDKDDNVAEVLVGFLGGNRSHAVVMMIDDRRHRLKNQEEGEVALYDDQGQILRITRKGIIIASGKAVTHEVSEPKQRGDKDYGQDANAERSMKTRIVQGSDHIQIQVGEKTFMRLDEKGIKLQTDEDKNIVSKVEGGKIVAEGKSTGWDPGPTGAGP
jgi:phage gp45-like